MHTVDYTPTLRAPILSSRRWDAAGIGELHGRRARALLGVRLTPPQSDALSRKDNGTSSLRNWEITWLVPCDSSRGLMREHKFTATYWFGMCESAVRVLKRGRPVSRGRPGTIKPSGSLQRARLMTEPGSRFREIIAGHHKIILSSPVLIWLRALTLSVSTQTVSSLRCLLPYILSWDDLCTAWRTV